MGFSKLTLTAISAAKKASTHMMKYWNKTVPGVRNKDGKSLVSQIDLECEQIILKEIQKTYPTHNFVTEESSPQHNKSPFTWHIDPIDGTHNYVRGLPIFGTSVACVKNGTVVTGVMTLPVFKKLYVAQKNKGAWCNGKQLAVSPNKKIDFSTIFLDGGMNGRKKLISLQKKLINKLHSERIWGCAIFDLICVAEGKMDAGYMFDTNSWDVAAGALLIQEAGGKVKNETGKKWSIEDPGIVVSNGIVKLLS